MKYSDLASIGIASGAYVEASKAHAGVNQLSRDIYQLRQDVDNQTNEREFQKWAEEVIYQFDKTVTNVSNSPQDPVHDYIDIATFLLLIEEHNLTTARIDGLKKKAKLEQTLVKAKQLLLEFEKTSEIQDFYEKHQEEERLKQEEERLRKEKAQLEAEERKAERCRVEAKKLEEQWRKAPYYGLLFFVLISALFFFIDKGFSVILLIVGLPLYLIWWHYFSRKKKKNSR